MTTLTPSERAAFDDLGWVRVAHAFAAADAAAMRDEVWAKLATLGIDRADRTTWTEEAPTHLQKLKRSPAFDGIGTTRTLGAIDDLLGEDTWDHPPDSGAFFILFPDPSRRSWTPPAGPWHIDAPYTDPLTPLMGLKVHSLFGEVPSRGGAMTVIQRSHRVVAQYVEQRPPPPGATMRRTRLGLLRSDPWLRALTHDKTSPTGRIARFVDNTEEVFGVPVSVAELTGEAGDVILIHPLLLHARPVNTGDHPRFLCNRDLRVRNAPWCDPPW